MSSRSASSFRAASAWTLPFSCRLPVHAAVRLLGYTLAFGPALLLSLGLITGLAGLRNSAQAAEETERPPLNAQSQVALPYGGQVSKDIAERIARVLARNDVLRQSESILASLTAVRFGLDDARQKLALAAVALRPRLTVPPENEQPGVVTVQAEAQATDSMSDAVQVALGKPDELELKTEALLRAAALAEEAGELLQRAEAARTRGGDQPDAPFMPRLASLDTRIQALEQYMELMDRFSSEWQPPEEAFAALSKLLKLDPDNSLFHLGAAEILLRLDRPQASVRAATEALRLEPEMARAFYTRGLAQLRQQLTALAMADFDQALALRQDKAAWWRARGAARLVQHDYERMCPDLYQACTLGDCSGLAEVRDRGLCSGGK